MNKNKIKSTKVLGQAYGIEILPSKGYRLTFIDDFGCFIKQEFKTMEAVLKEIKLDIYLTELENNINLKNNRTL